MVVDSLRQKSGQGSSKNKWRKEEISLLTHLLLTATCSFCNLGCLMGTVSVNPLAFVNLSFCHQVWVLGGKINVYLIHTYIFKSAFCPIHRG